ncbi:hypothetical protein J2Z76_001582 [Sedimentibacter acidaminivorans]|uniref:Uncharacterized protein n=1 Tax=Sedimentibacter acidaminivorans TaxID=913099 RepID=A0ABS4GDE4_9FIRM|nr:hypothetical protein [Sedimentibacter acidaminivorans]MBP1925721.1 hypothetical protein [Sedimentibacter acidaminivorans]
MKQGLASLSDMYLLYRCETSQLAACTYDIIVIELLTGDSIHDR